MKIQGRQRLIVGGVCLGLTGSFCIYMAIASVLLLRLPILKGHWDWGREDQPNVLNQSREGWESDFVRQTNLSNLFVYCRQCLFSIWTMSWGVYYVISDKRYLWSNGLIRGALCFVNFGSVIRIAYHRHEVYTRLILPQQLATHGQTSQKVKDNVFNEEGKPC